VFRKDKLSSSRIHYCYIIFSTEFKLSCWLCNLSSGLKEKNLQTKECKGKKDVCPFFLLENSRPLSPWGPLDFLSICLGIDSLTPAYQLKKCRAKSGTSEERLDVKVEFSGGTVVVTLQELDPGEPWMHRDLLLIRTPLL